MKAREASLAEDKGRALARVAQMKLRAELSREPFLLQDRHDPHILEDFCVVRQQRFADVKTREYLLLQQQHLAAGAREVGRSRASARPTPDHQHIKTLRFHSLH